MAATRPGLGPVVVSTSSQPTTVIGSTASQRAEARRLLRSRNGDWRPNLPYSSTDGLKLILRRATGLTPVNRLHVPMRFQCPPTGEFSRDWAFEWARFQTLRVGERSRPQGKPLKTWQISTMLMDEAAAETADFVIWEGDPDPQRTIAELAILLGDDPATDAAKPVPFRLTITQDSVWGSAGPERYIVNSVAVLSGMRATQRPGEVGVEFIDLTFDEFDPLEIERMRRGDKPGGQDTYRLGSGDDLYVVSLRVYRDPSLWRTIAKANGMTNVSPGDPKDLARWAKRHHRKTLKIPARG
jgi:hypothetical protein